MMKKVIVITGPTAIGKTDISLLIAKYFNGEIINADASQFRRGLNIGTAKININEVDVTHHLIDIINIEDEFSIKDFQELARKKIDELHNKNILPILVGGSGLYINAVIGNYELDDNSRNIEIEEAKYKDYDNTSLHKVLESLDYEASINIHPNNRRRVLRAIQKAHTGNKISTLNQGNKLIFDALIIQLTTPRELLYSRINKRFEVMLEDGWLEEVKSLKELGYDLTKVKDIGYKEIANYLDGLISLDEAREEITKKTRNYAKRQITWFRNKMDTVEVSVDYENINKTIASIKKYINEFLN